MNDWIEIFDAAAHTRDWPKTAADVARIAASYDPAFHEGPIKFDHGIESGPALGWIAALKASGTKLLARLRDVQAEFKEAVLTGRYKKFSAEFYPNLQGRGPYFRALAVLGAAIPECKGLNPLPTGYFTERDRAGGGFVKVEGQFKLYAESNRMNSNSVFCFSERSKPADVRALSESDRRELAQLERECFAEIAQVLAQDRKIGYGEALVMTERMGRRPARARIARYREDGCVALDPGRRYLAAAASGYARAKGVSYHDALAAVARDPHLLKFGEAEGNAAFQQEFLAFAEQALANEEAAEQEAEAERLEKGGESLTQAISADRRKILLLAQRLWNEEQRQLKAGKISSENAHTLADFLDVVAKDFMYDSNAKSESQRAFDAQISDEAEQLALQKRIPYAAALRQVVKDYKAKRNMPVDTSSYIGDAVRDVKVEPAVYRG